MMRHRANDLSPSAPRDAAQLDAGPASDYDPRRRDGPVGMDRLHLDRHVSGRFNAARQLRERELAMGGQVEEQVAAAVRAVAHRDPVRSAQFAFTSSPRP